MAAKKRDSASEEPVVSFEDGVGALEGLVAELESGELPLEKALESFERGVQLVRRLNDRLNEAERKIEILSRGPDGDLIVRSHRQSATNDTGEVRDPGGSRDSEPAADTDDDCE